MATAVCVGCGMQWRWKAGKGRKLADLTCTDCGSGLKARRTGDFTFNPPRGGTMQTDDPDRLAWTLGTTPEQRLAEIERHHDGAVFEKERVAALKAIEARGAKVEA